MRSANFNGLPVFESVARLMTEPFIFVSYRRWQRLGLWAAVSVQAYERRMGPARRECSAEIGFPPAEGTLTVRHALLASWSCPRLAGHRAMVIELA